MLDIRNAFNSARWCSMLDALIQSLCIPGYLLQMLDDYLKHCTPCVHNYGRAAENLPAVTSGAAQESVLGPDLWNVAYDSLLQIEMPKEMVWLDILTMWLHLPCLNPLT